MEYSAHFERPTSERDILGDKLRIEPDSSNLLKLIEDLDPKKEAIVVNFPIIPGGYGKYPFFEDWMNFLKRGPVVNLRVPDSRSESIENKIGPTRLRIDAVERMNPAEAYAGYVWNSQRSRSKNKVHLVDCIEGAKLLAFGKKQGKIKVKPYTDVWNVKDFGGIFEVEVPSRSGKDPHTVVLRSVPLPRTNEQFAVWTDLNSRHGCDLSVHDAITFSRRIPEYTFCPHEIAAYLAVADYIYHESKAKYGTGRLILIPFAMPTQLTVDFYNKTRNNLMIEEEKKINRKLRLVKRPSTKAEQERLLWSFTSTKRDEKGRLHRPTWFTKTKLVNYNWD